LNLLSLLPWITLLLPVVLLEVQVAAVAAVLVAIVYLPRKP
jgi:hypothetical protein